MTTNRANSEEKLVINLHGLKTNLKVQYGKRLIFVAENNSNEAISSHPIVIALKEIVGATDDVAFRKATAEMGTAVADADLNRDEMHNSLKRLLEGFSGFKHEKGEAANELLKFFDKPIYGLSYSAETMVIDALIKNLNLAKSKTLIEIAGVASEVDALKSAQDSFMTIFSEKQDITSELGKQRSASSYNRELTAAIRNFLNFVWSMRHLPDWNDLYHDVLQETQSARLLTN